jgi:hypothetical protein
VDRLKVGRGHQGRMMCLALPQNALWLRECLHYAVIRRS